jgi:hypothetical protein
MIKFILLICSIVIFIHIGISILAKELYKFGKITSEECEYYSSYEYILDKITSFFKHE